MKTKHTSGPWYLKAGGREIHDRDTKFDSDGARVGDTPNIIAAVASCVPSIGTEWRETSQANARLIVAAPELLSALENLVDLISKKPNIGVVTYIGMEKGAVEAAQKAIDKAKGENR